MNTIIKNFLKGTMAKVNAFFANPRVMMTLTMIFCLGLCNVFAAVDPFATSVTTIKGYKDSVQNLLYAIAAIIALVGAFNVFHKMTNGDQDVKKTIMMTLGGCIAMVALSAALPAFFD